MKLYWSMIPSTDKIRNSFTVSVGRQIVLVSFCVLVTMMFGLSELLSP